MPRKHSIGRISLACCAGLLAATLSGLGSSALAAPSSTIKGSPQPELASFVAGTANGPSSATTDGDNGNLIIAYRIATKNTEGGIQVCVLKRGARSCASKTDLYTKDASSVDDSPFVTVEDNGDVFVAMDECCGANDLLFESTNGGRTFGAPVPLGTASGPNIDAAEAFGVHGVGHIMWAENDAGTKFPVEFAPFSDPANATVVTAMADTASADFFTAGLGSYKGGVIAAGSDSNDATIASFAPAGSTVFHKVGRFTGQQLIAVSGQALVTQLTSGSQSLVLRLFNGTSFGPPHVVPKSGGGGPNWNTAYETPAGRTFVFTERNQDGYDLEGQSTISGSTWSTRVNMGSAIKSNAFSAAIDNTGAGIVVGTSGPLTVWPVLPTQNVTFSLSKSKVDTGTAITASGTGSSPKAGRRVQLEQLEGKLWHNIATTTESASGKFSFHIAGHGTVGSYTYRAYVDWNPGYLQYGYSPGRAETVVKPKS